MLSRYEGWKCARGFGNGDGNGICGRVGERKRAGNERENRREGKGREGRKGIVVVVVIIDVRVPREEKQWRGCAEMCSVCIATADEGRHYQPDILFVCLFVETEISPFSSAFLHFLSLITSFFPPHVCGCR